MIYTMLPCAGIQLRPMHTLRIPSLRERFDYGEDFHMTGFIELGYVLTLINVLLSAEGNNKTKDWKLVDRV